MSPASATPKKTSAKKAGPKEPTSSVMVKKAIAELADRKGSSLAAIKKYISAHYQVDIAKRAPFIRKAIKTAVEKGVLIQIKGQGAAGVFKLAPKAKSPAKAPKSPKEKTAAKKSTKAKSPVKKSPKKKTTKAKTPKKASKPKAKTPKKAPAKKAAKKTSVKKATKKTAKKA
eukprot:TRINITY_DN22209_c0_g1_i1.p1 TRINITY_DN22209_c0_g1~~TRINITY_DN22209_c0_g1_i1.p1  ORF type:complete len:179 (-),score=98.85 TRINITY_DN22209_c0_g1_i1:13-528(-)